jgi:hypothetical protein
MIAEIRDDVRWFLVVAATLLTLAFSCGCRGGVAGPNPVTPSLEPTWREDRSDLLNYFLGHRPEGLQPRAPNNTAQWLALGWEGNEHAGRSFTMKTIAPRNGELHRWDDNFVYLVEDGQDGARSYAFSRGMWLPRRGKVGDRIEQRDNTITWYDASCRAEDPRGWPIAVTIDSQGPYDFGGKLGVLDTLWITYWWPTRRIDILDPAERFAYTWEWGWVAWQGVVNNLPVYAYNDPQPASTPLVLGFCR